MIDEVLILTDNDGAVFARFFPNPRIIGGVKAKIENMRGVMSLARNPARQSGRELSIDNKIHAGCNTAWSAWRAA